MSVTRPLPHDSARLHVTGQARYVDDAPSPKGTLHLAFALSKTAKGTLTALDLSAARTEPGVVAVWGAQDLVRPADCSPSNHDEPLLCDGPVQYLGQPLALVIATSHLAARRAAQKVAAQIAEEDPVLDLDTALARNLRFEDGPRIYAKGDPDAVFSEATRVIEGRIEIGGQEHFYLEGQAALALPQDDGGMHVLSSTQHPTEIQHKVADALGLPMHSVRVETRRMGGGFGGKESQGNALAIACALAAEATGRACKMRYDRDDDFLITGKRHDMRIDYRAAVSEEGLIAALDVVQLVRCGWSMDLSLPVADRAMLHSGNCYEIPHMRVTSHRLKTNTQSATAFRGFGGPQGMLGMERVIDHIAHALGRDPAEVRRTNYFASSGGALGASPAPGGTLRDASGGSLSGQAYGVAGRADADGLAPADLSGIEPGRGGTPPDAAVGHVRGTAATARVAQTTLYGQEVDGFELDAMTDTLLADCNYAARRAEIAAFNEQSPVLKKGIAFSPVMFGISFTLTHLNQAGALVHVYQDGSIHLNHGGTEMGQGLFQKVAQVAAARFGVPLEMVKITATDTAKVPNTSATAASSGSDLNGMAVQNACDTIRARMAEFLAEKHQCDPSEVRFAEGRVTTPAAEYSFAEVAKMSWMERISLSATGFYKTPEIVWDRIKGQGRPFFYFAHGAAVTEVLLDTLTGENRITRTDILHDAGASLNPALDIGQVEGGYVQGAGWLTTEELVWDAKGALRTHAPSTYKIPAFADRPQKFNVALWDASNRAETVYRSKAVGEPPLMLAISALLALSDACAACGPNYPDLHAPATPEALLAAVGRARGQRR